MKGERGFAMLFVFVMAAAVAIILYRDLPRVAFEAQRNREDVLIARGEQYTRAIQLYVRKFKKYPGKIEDLEETNQIRFLRKRYIDPLTGKSEWRMIHMGPGGVFTDSLTHKPPSKDKEETKAVNTFTYEAPPVGSTLPQNGQTDPAFPQGRPSERAGFRLPGQAQPGQPGDPANPQQQPAGFVAGVGFQGQPQTGVNPLQGVPGMPPGVHPQQAYPGAPVNSQTGGVAPSFPYSTQPGVQGAPQQFQQPGVGFNPLAPPQQQGQNQALNLINQILTTPRPSGIAGGANQPMAGLQIAGGIAGVASTVERTGIKIYNEKSKYNEWEFIYDLTKDTKGTAGTTGIAGAPQPQQGTQSPSGQQTPAAQMPSPYTGQPPGGNPQPPVVQQQHFQPTWLQPQPQPQQPQPTPPPPPPPPPPQPISPP